MITTQAKERPIIFSRSMVNAILDGKKTQTRRFINPQPDDVREGKPIIPCNRLVEGPGGQRARITGRSIECRYGRRGERLWVRETWADAVDASPEAFDRGTFWPQYLATSENCLVTRWRPSIFMPRWASRITLAIEDVRVERLQKISEEDAKAEGAAHRITGDGDLAGAFAHVEGSVSYVSHFKDLWDSLNAKRGFGWKTNPFVWVLEFRVMQDKKTGAR